MFVFIDTWSQFSRHVTALQMPRDHWHGASIALRLFAIAFGNESLFNVTTLISVIIIHGFVTHEGSRLSNFVSVIKAERQPL